jgi:hypothetical protein
VFEIDCPTCRARVLLGTAHIIQVRNVSAGIELAYRCACGTPGVLRTGARRPTRP